MRKTFFSHGDSEALREAKTKNEGNLFEPRSHGDTEKGKDEE
jgi:hypothetical protein